MVKGALRTAYISRIYRSLLSPQRLQPPCSAAERSLAAAIRSCGGRNCESAKVPAMGRETETTCDRVWNQNDTRYPLRGRCGILSVETAVGTAPPVTTYSYSSTGSAFGWAIWAAASDAPPRGFDRSARLTTSILRCRGTKLGGLFGDMVANGRREQVSQSSREARNR